MINANKKGSIKENIYNMIHDIKANKNIFISNSNNINHDKDYLKELESLRDYALSIKVLNDYIQKIGIFNICTISSKYFDNCFKYILNYANILQNKELIILSLVVYKRLYTLMNNLNKIGYILPDLLLNNFKHNMHNNILSVFQLFGKYSIFDERDKYKHIYHKINNNFSRYDRYNFLTNNKSLSNKKLRKYQYWICYNDLSLNPFNCVGMKLPISNLSKDIISIDSPVAVTFKLIKEDYMSARRLFHKGYQHYLEHKNNIMSNIMQIKDIQNIVPLDIYSYYVEQMKMSFMMLFSIFNRIAFLIINDFNLHNNNSSSKDYKRNYKLWKTINYKSLFDNRIVKDSFAKQPHIKGKTLVGLYLITSFLDLKTYKRFKNNLSKCENPNIHGAHSIGDNDIQITVSRNQLEHGCLNIVPNSFDDKYIDNRFEVIDMNDLKRLSIWLMKRCKESIILCYILLVQNPYYMRHIYNPQ